MAIMNFREIVSVGRAVFAGLIALALAVCAPRANANVYATNIKLNDGTNNVTVSPGTPVTISYILNEPASGGVRIDIGLGAGVARSIALTNGQPGTFRGANSVEWDGNVPAGVYSVSVTATSAGYTNWTLITDDTNPGNYVWEGRGIAVNRNPSSPYYGRVYVSNARDGLDPVGVPGDAVGILKLNADASPAEEGASSTGGHPWAGDLFSPWKIEVSDEGWVYVNDFTAGGEVFRWDPVLSPESKLHVLRPDNYPYPQVQLSGPALAVDGTNLHLWMADASTSGSIGLVRYNLSANGACPTNNTGVNAVPTGGSLDVYAYDVAADQSGGVYTIQNFATPGDPSPRVLRFTAPSGAVSVTNADWAIGAGDNTMGRASGVAVDPTGKYVAVAFRGIKPGADSTNGCTQIFSATNGALVANLDLGVPINGETKHENTDCAWDAVGNVYYIDNWAAAWRAFSPPGTNQAVTRALATIQVSGNGGGSQMMPIHSVTVSGGVVTMKFAGAAGDAPTSFVVQTTTSVVGSFAPAANASVTAGSAPGEFQATVPVAGATQFYRVVKGS
jgi:hypothetical protein